MQIAAGEGLFYEVVEERKIEVDTKLVMVSIAPRLRSNVAATAAISVPEGLLDIAVYPGLGEGALLRYYFAKRDWQAEGVALGKGSVTIRVAQRRALTAQTT